MGNIGSFRRHVNITSERQRHQAKNEARANMQSIFRTQAESITRAGSLLGKRQIMVDSRSF